MKHQRLIVILHFILFNVFAWAQNPAIIRDSDGFTNIRKGPGKSFEVIDSLIDNEIFYYQMNDTSNWVKVSAWKGNQTNGFIHKSRIQNLTDLFPTALQTFIFQVLDSQATNAINLRKVHNQKDSLAYIKFSDSHENYSDTKYDPILQVIPNYFCTTSDSSLIKKLFKTMWGDRSTANEMPSFAIGRCYICNPALIETELLDIDDKKQRSFLINNIEWGLLNVLNSDEWSDDPEFNTFMSRIKALQNN